MSIYLFNCIPFVLSRPFRKLQNHKEFKNMLLRTIKFWEFKILSLYAWVSQGIVLFNSVYSAP